ncbi:PilZ domain-containing protein [Sedimenticola selenatireducens]|uniref:PilZ domain-containing protein n=1 Tax=Sedimenticola selenatireducens TaxID=191960 RepID=UPI002AAC258F|nr:PilZ domain-containing protein [Sedimenticola selenatireducens]
MYFGKKYETAPQGNSVADERRAILRRHLIYYLRVWDTATDKLLGHIVDINTDGLMLISEKQIETGKPFELEIRWQDMEGNPERIRFSAVSRWSNNDINSAFFDTGFQLVDPSEEILEPIRKMIHQYGFGE